jgi:hypothetical protein
VQAGAEYVGNLAFIHEGRQLRFADGQLSAVLDLHVLHGITPGQNPIFRLAPLDDIDELFG